MNYQWYPGHMTKARRMMQENIKLIDLVIELVDARIPISSRNPDIDELGKGKSRIILLNKSDLADPVWNKKWVEYFQIREWVYWKSIPVPVWESSRFRGWYRKSARRRLNVTESEAS